MPPPAVAAPASVASPVQASLGRVTLNPKFIERFYAVFLARDPKIKARFVQTDWATQRAMLKHSIAMVVMMSSGAGFAVGAIDRLGKSHDRQGHAVTAGEYAHWRAALLQVLRELDPLYTPALQAAWEKVIDAAIKRMLSHF